MTPDRYRVAFTADPSTGAQDRVVIEAAFDQGQVVVSEKVRTTLKFPSEARADAWDHPRHFLQVWESSRAQTNNHVAAQRICRTLDYGQVRPVTSIPLSWQLTKPRSTDELV
jgi:hypothetical protein